MSDAEHPELSKRQRQKQRRQQKREAQRAHVRRARRRRRVTVTAIVLVLLLAAGLAAAPWVLRTVEERRLIAAAEERMDALGCTPVEERPIETAVHIPPAEWANHPPEEIYTHRPTTSGPHFDPVAQTGVYDKVVDERLLVHNLEHGYVNVFYDPDADPDEIAALTAFADEQIDSGRHEKLIVSQWKAEMPDDANFAWTAWGARQLCRDFDEGVLLAFLRDWHWHAGQAPEAGVQPHRGPGDGGGIDPEEQEGDLLFPPLGDADPGLPGATPHGVEDDDEPVPLGPEEPDQQD